MQQARFSITLLMVSMIVPLHILADTSADQNEAQHEQVPALPEKEVVPAPAHSASESSMPYSPQGLFEKYNAKLASEALLAQAEKEKALKTTASDDALKHCMDHGKTKKHCLHDLYKEAVKVNDPKCSYAIAKERIAETTNKAIAQEKEKLKSELEEAIAQEKEKLKKAQNQMYMKIGAVVLVVGVAAMYGSYKYGASRTAVTEQGIASAVIAQLGDRAPNAQERSAELTAGFQPLASAIAALPKPLDAAATAEAVRGVVPQPLSGQATGEIVTQALRPIAEAIEKLSQKKGD